MCCICSVASVSLWFYSVYMDGFMREMKTDIEANPRLNGVEWSLLIISFVDDIKGTSRE